MFLRRYFQDGKTSETVKTLPVDAFKDTLSPGQNFSTVKSPLGPEMGQMGFDQVLGLIQPFQLFISNFG